jgi:hypothetical protein
VLKIEPPEDSGSTLSVHAIFTQSGSENDANWSGGSAEGRGASEHACGPLMRIVNGAKGSSSSGRECHERAHDLERDRVRSVELEVPRWPVRLVEGARE